MKESLQTKLTLMSERHEEVGTLLSDPEIVADNKKFQELSKEYSQLQPVVDAFTKYQEVVEGIASSKELLNDSDPDMRAMAKDELSGLQKQYEELEQELQILLLPRDEDDDKNVFLEIRAGTGGDEASIFSGDLFRMYSRYADSQGWQVEIVNSNEGEHGGYKEIIAQIKGNEVYGKLKFESGAHRVQRVPTTESQGRVHTSACTVAIMPEFDEVDAVEINAADLRVDTFRASGAGGQHVNKTDSAIRLTHIPTGVVVECQDERSQHKNRARAMSLLQSRLLTAQKEKQEQEQAQTRRSLVGSGDRSERIRTYNFPQGRVTDHRINLTLYRLDDVMMGELGLVLESLRQEYQADLLATLNDS